MPLIGISGGIGSGKSVVSEILRCMGFAVYDCDKEAKRIMDNDREIHESLCRQIHHEAVKDCKVNRALISEIVFSDSRKLQLLNEIVHRAVFRDIGRWRTTFPYDSLLFVESAILRSSGLIDYIDVEWNVEAPLDVRIARVEKRSSLSHDQIAARIKAQENEENIPTDKAVYYIDNSPLSALLPQIHRLLGR